MTKPWIYIAGPYSGGDTIMNIRAAVLAGLALRDAGFVPIVPHTSGFMHYLDPREYEFWMEWDFDLLSRCDCLLILPGESPGAERELERFTGDHVFASVAHAVEWLESQKG